MKKYPSIYEWYYMNKRYLSFYIELEKIPPKAAANFDFMSKHINCKYYYEVYLYSTQSRESTTGLRQRLTIALHLHENRHNVNRMDDILENTLRSLALHGYEARVFDKEEITKEIFSLAKCGFSSNIAREAGCSNSGNSQSSFDKVLALLPQLKSPAMFSLLFDFQKNTVHGKAFAKTKSDVKLLSNIFNKDWHGICRKDYRIQHYLSYRFREASYKKNMYVYTNMHQFKLPSGEYSGLPISRAVVNNVSIPEGLVNNPDAIKIGMINSGSESARRNMVTLPYKNLNGHLFCGGSSGSGKTTLLKNMLYGMKECHFVLIDLVKKDFRNMAMQTNSAVYGVSGGEASIIFNPMNIYGLSRDENKELTVKLLKDILNLHPPIDQYVERAVYELYNSGQEISIQSLREKIEQLFEERYPYSPESTANMKTATLVRLEKMGNVFKDNVLLDVDAFLTHNNIIELADYDDIEKKCMLLTALLSAILKYKRILSERGNNKQHIIIVDELHSVLPDDGMNEDENRTVRAFQRFLLKCMDESREFGLSLILCDQNLQRCKHFLEKAHTQILMHTNEICDGAAKIMGITTNETSELRCGEFYFKTGDMITPLMVKALPPASTSTSKNIDIKEYMNGFPKAIIYEQTVDKKEEAHISSIENQIDENQIELYSNLFLNKLVRDFLPLLYNEKNSFFVEEGMIRFKPGVFDAVFNILFPKLSANTLIRNEIKLCLKDKIGDVPFFKPLF